MSDPVVLLSTGDVVGPAGGVTDNSMVLFSGTSGKLIKGNNAQVTSAGLALLDDIDANAQLTTLGLTTTQPQFDNSVKQATTEFVKRTGLNYGGIVVHSATEAILAADMGKIHLTSTVGSITLTLPAANSVPVGTAFTIFGSGIGAATIQRAGSDTILPNGSAVTSITCGNGDFLTFTVASSAQWYVAGSTQLGYSAAFGSLLSSNGYQKLPSGLIIQWGTTSHTGDSITWTYPIAFPNAVVSVFANMKTDNGCAIVYTLGIAAAAGSSTLSWVNTTGTHSYNWLAVGY